MKKNSLISGRTLTQFLSGKMIKIMKLSICLLLLSVMNAFAVKSYSQMTMISLDLEDATVETALKTIEGKSEFYFLFSPKMVDVTHKVDMSFKNRKINEILDELLAETNIEYVVKDRQIVLTTQEMIQSFEPAQPVTITGTVTDENGEPVVGASIIIKGTTQGTISDGDGKYTINVDDPGEILVFSFIGMLTQEIPLGDQTQISVIMKKDILGLEEVVITSFGLKKKKRTISYSTETVSIKELTKARELNVVNSLRGKVAGLLINESGNGLGSESRVILRGNRSISGNSQPLYVVDGLPIIGGISTLNQDNIASINVLKGPNAAALYGSQAQNGVIIIETKKGTAGVVDVSLNSTFMTGEAILLLDVQDEYGQGVSGIYNGNSEESWGPKMEGQMVDHWSPALAGTQYALLPHPDNFKKIFQSTYNASNGFNASVGTENTQSAFSYTRTDARGMIPNNKLGRHNLSLRVNNKLTNWLSLDSKISYMQQKIDNVTRTGDTPINPFRNIYRIPRNISDKDLANFEYATAEGSIRQNYWNPGSTSGKNPYWVMNRMQNFEDQRRVIAFTSLTLDFTENLRLIARTSYTGLSSHSELRTHEDSYSPQWNFGYYRVAKSGSKMWNTDILLSYTKDITEDLSFDGLIGGTLRKTGGEGSLIAATTQKLLLTNFFALSNTLVPATEFVPSSETETQSLFFSGNIGWKDGIYMNVTGRNDWSSTLPASNRSYFYPSVGLSAVLTNLIPTLPEYISFAKVRASWAEVGNSAPPYMLTRYGTFRAGGFNGFLTMDSVLPNDDLKPETTQSFEVGLDFRFFDERLGLDITAYKTNTFDQLFTIALPIGSGASSYFTNGGDVENRGMEVLLLATPVRTSNLTWDVNINFFTNRNWVNQISDERPLVVVGGDTYLRDLVVEQDHEFGDIYTRGWIRDDQDRVIVNANGVPQITSGKTVKVANFNPDWAGGISNIISYRNFHMSFLIEHRQGGTYVSSTDAVLFGDGVAQETAQGRDGGLIFGQNLFPNETAVLEDGTTNNIAVNAQEFWRSVGGRNTPVGEAFVQDATNTRLRELSLGFTLPQSILAKLPVSNVEFSLVGRNLFFIYIKGNWDPEVLTSISTAAAGFQGFVPPSQRSIGFNLRIDL